MENDMEENLPNESGVHSRCGHEPNGPPATSSDNRLIYPVCGMEVAADSAKSVQHTGATFYFCSQRSRSHQSYLA